MGPGQQMTILGLVALCYYAALLASGVVDLDVMPQFVVSAVIFLSSGRLLRSVARSRLKKNGNADKPVKEPDWNLRAQVLNWVMAFMVMSALGLWVLKPVGVPFLEWFGLK